MYLIAGLGNPGKKYEATRHNIGFETVYYLSKTQNFSKPKLKHKAYIAEGVIGTEKVIIAQPQTFMNNSGESILEIKNFYKIEDKNIIIIYDDLDLEIGRIRIRPKGSAGTHNGMKSIIYLLNTDSFPRIRIGIGKPSYETIDFVLSRFKKEEIPVIESAIKRAADAVLDLVLKGVDFAMNNYNA